MTALVPWKRSKCPLKAGALLIYPYGPPRTPKGVVTDGPRRDPDIEVNLSRKELLAGKDSQLEAAMEFIKSGKKVPMRN